MNNYKIYLHKNKINGKVYIGQTKEDDVNRRFRGGAGYRSSPHFYRAIQEDGWDNFEHLILETGLTSEMADIREKFWIKAFDATNPKKGYNLTSGGKTKPSGIVPNNRKQVVCQETGDIFNSLADAAEWAGLNRTSASNISAQIQGKRPTAGRHPKTNEPLHWYLLGEECNNIRPCKKGNAKKVKNIDTGEIFDSVNDAAKAYQISNVTISKSCKSNGTIPVGSNKKKKFRWIFMN